jgi:hypothetical protein
MEQEHENPKEGKQPIRALSSFRVSPNPLGQHQAALFAFRIDSRQ